VQPAGASTRSNVDGLATPLVISVISLMTNVTNFARRIIIESRHWTILLNWADGPSTNRRKQT
jgi:hypothetical protein